MKKKMKLSRRAKAFTEYIIIIVVMIVIAVVVVIAIGKFPGIGNNSFGKSSAAYWASQDIAITEYTVSGTNPAIFTVKNNLRNPVTITSLKVGNTTIGNQGVLGPGASKIITSEYAISCQSSCTTSKDFSCNVTLSYTDVNTGGTYVLTGKDHNLEGTCKS